MQGVVLVVSLEDRVKLAKQLASLDYWLDQISSSSAEKQMSFILSANKADACSSSDGRQECEAAIFIHAIYIKRTWTLRIIFHLG